MQRGSEIVTHCVFNDCDTETKHAGHLRSTIERCIPLLQVQYWPYSELVEHFEMTQLDVVSEKRACAGCPHHKKPKPSSTLPASRLMRAQCFARDPHGYGERGISEEIVAQAKIGWDGHVSSFQLFPDGGFSKRRQPPGLL